MLSIIIPTYNEEENILYIVKQIRDILKNINYEIIFVDDSKDNTVKYLEKASIENSNVRYFHRENERGLATAVILGFSKAIGETIAVMDADLQHPPELLVSMYEAIRAGADIALPSRFIPGGDDGGLNLFRKLISYTARKIGGIFIKKLRSFSDNTSGFFMFKKEIIKDCSLDPIGWKILMEVLVKAKYKKVVEIPYSFKERNAGESKMSMKEQINYLKHIVRLLKNSPADLRFVSFCLVGIFGVFINLIIYSMLVNMGLKLIIAAFFSALCAMISNFILNDLITWREIKSNSVVSRILKNFTTSIIGIVINLCILFLLENYTSINYIIDNGMAIFIATMWNYVINKSWTWKNANTESEIQVIQWEKDDVVISEQNFNSVNC